MRALEQIACHSFRNTTYVQLLRDTTTHTTYLQNVQVQVFHEELVQPRGAANLREYRDDLYFMRHIVSRERFNKCSPFFVLFLSHSPQQFITLAAGSGATWYLFRLAKGPDVIWDRKVS